MTTPLSPAARQGNWHFANSLGLLVLRLVLGGIFVYSGAGKLFGGMHGFISFITSQNLPVLPGAVWAYMAAGGEFFGGLCILLGLLTRLATLPLIVTMLVAIATVHGKNGFTGTPVPNVPGAMYQGYALNVTLLTMSITLLLTGAGLISLDALLFKRGLWSHGPQPLDQPERRG